MSVDEGWNLLQGFESVMIQMDQEHFDSCGKEKPNSTPLVPSSMRDVASRVDPESLDGRLHSLVGRQPASLSEGTVIDVGRSSFAVGDPCRTKMAGNRLRKPL